MARDMLLGAYREDASRPDQFRCAKPFVIGGRTRTGEYWKDPFIKYNP